MSSVIIAGNTSGTVTLAAPDVAGTTTLTLPTTSGTVLTSATPFSNGQGPAFSAWSSTTVTANNNTTAKMPFNQEFFDTASCFDTSTYRFTPNVAGYYQVNLSVFVNTSSGVVQSTLFKNGAQYLVEITKNDSAGIAVQVSTVLYLNGTTDYIEGYIYQTSGSSYTTWTNRPDLYQFSAALVRGA